MKVLTVKTRENITPETQREIHSILRMEFQSDYVFKDLEDSQYSATISIADTQDTIKTIQENSRKIPDYTLIVHVVDMEANKVERITLQDGEILNQKSGSLEWNDEE